MAFLPAVLLQASSAPAPALVAADVTLAVALSVVSLPAVQCDLHPIVQNDSVR